MCSVIHIPALAVLRQLCVSTSTVTPEWVPKTTFVVRRYCSSLHQVLQQKKTEGESSSPPLRMVRMKCKNSLIWLILFLESVSVGLFFFIILHSYDGLISHFLGRLGRHRTLGGVRPFHVGHEQAHFLIGPPPLRVQLTVIPKWHLRLNGRRVGGGDTGGDSGGEDRYQYNWHRDTWDRVVRIQNRNNMLTEAATAAQHAAHKLWAKGLILICHFWWFFCGRLKD